MSTLFLRLISNKWKARSLMLQTCSNFWKFLETTTSRLDRTRTTLWGTSVLVSKIYQFFNVDSTKSKKSEEVYYIFHYPHDRNYRHCKNQITPKLADKTSGSHLLYDMITFSNLLTTPVFLLLLLHGRLVSNLIGNESIVWRQGTALRSEEYVTKLRPWQRPVWGANTLFLLFFSSTGIWGMHVGRLLSILGN